MTGKTVLIAGATRGIGLGLAQHYKKQGWNVLATARNVDGASDLKSLGPAKLLPLDTTDEQSITKLAESLKGQPIDVLINCAGYMNPLGLQETTKEELMRHFDVNAVGPFLMTRALLPNLKEAVKSNGSSFVFQVTSRMGSIADNGSGGNYSYRASKSSLNMLNKSLSVDLKDEKIGCVLLHPGAVRTEMTQNQGLVDVDESVEGLTKIIADATLEDNGKFYHFKGEELPW